MCDTRRRNRDGSVRYISFSFPAAEVGRPIAICRMLRRSTTPARIQDGAGQKNGRRAHPTRGTLTAAEDQPTSTARGWGVRPWWPGPSTAPRPARSMRHGARAPASPGDRTDARPCCPHRHDRAPARNTTGMGRAPGCTAPTDAAGRLRHRVVLAARPGVPGQINHRAWPPGRRRRAVNLAVGDVVMHAWLRWLGRVMARVADRSQARDVTAMGT